MRKDSLTEQIDQKAKYYLKEQLDLLERLVNIDSGTGNRKGNEKVVNIVSEILKGIGADIRYECGSYGNHIIAKLNKTNSKGKILVSAHLDTVFKEGDAKEHFFRIENDYAYGLGISDDKGGIITACYGLKIIKELNRLPDKEIVIIFNCDEEIGSHTSRKIFKEEGRNAEYAFVFEPARGNNGIITLRGGIGYYTVEVWGKEAHAGAQYEKGRNAIVELADKVLKIHKMTKLEDNILFNVGIIEGGNSCTVPSSIPGYARAKFSVRIKNADEMKKIQKEIGDLENQILIDGCKVKVSGEFVYLPMKREQNLPLYEIARIAGKSMGLDLDEIHTVAGSDANHIAAMGIPTIDALGAYQYGIHTKEEHIFIPSLTERTQLFSNILSLL